MCKVGYVVEVILTEEIMNLDLIGLVGCTGKVVEELDLPERKNKGYMISFEDKFQDELVWFIPKESVRYV